MVREFKLPDVGEGVAEGEIVAWLVETGDTVEEDQPVAEVETDKAVVDVPSPVNGTVQEIRAEEGEMVPVGDVIITFAVEGEDETDATGQEESTETRTDTATETDADGAEGEAAQAGAEAGQGGEVSTADGRVFAAPSARRLAREQGIDIATVEGSGPGGRVSEHDVRAAAEGGASEAGEAAEDDGTGGEEVTSAVSDVSDEAGTTAESGGAAGGGAGQASAPSAADRDRTLAAPATRRLAEEAGVDIDHVPTDEERDGEAFVSPAAVEAYAEAQQEAQAADTAAIAAGESGAGAQEERIPYRGVRRTIGQQMEASKFTAPHVTHHDEVDVTELVETRGELKEVAAERGISLSYMPFVMKACVAALREFPMVNAMLDEESEEIVQKKYYNVGVAAATDAGLMVPVVGDAGNKTLLQLASEMNELVEKARERSISREEMQGGTFTITNVGAIGGEYATPIVNHPEVAILALGAIKEKPRVVDGEVVPRHVMTVSLSFDHRVLDGAIAAQFTNKVEEYLEHPNRLLLE
ncbi:dihydrolipoamide acetyltransferase family protein [Halococcus saccharolyticus]|uniref:Branched-chain alpha-keto acid dehydrogenase subunit E2 n=1 Tax=Halococcus saccharolyticus DSM 5350 TaxID=1227455 RepID=M0MEQ6_9EURY|nr:dihydrolipoamide acetyltransferase family protein [Halococcus saccharolyticus]EMA43149.1 branched-chain alpha-keto acid dehydrogenase subunit E2 [Halococcus saccharolyticus DSM 5350]